MITIDTREKPRTLQAAPVLPQAAARAEQKSNGMMTVCHQRAAGPAAAQRVPLSATQSSGPPLPPRSGRDLHAHNQNSGPGQPSPVRTRGHADDSVFAERMFMLGCAYPCAKIVINEVWALSRIPF